MVSDVIPLRCCCQMPNAYWKYKKKIAGKIWIHKNINIKHILK